MRRNDAGRPAGAGPAERRVVQAIRLLRAKASDAQDMCRLGDEHQLSAEFGVCRSTMRSAVRELERQGVIRVVRGRLGGLYGGGRPSAEATQKLVDHLTLAELPTLDVAKFAMALYRLGIREATRRISPEGRQRLAHDIQKMSAMDKGNWSLEAWQIFRTDLVSLAGGAALSFLHSAYHGAYHNAMMSELHLVDIRGNPISDRDEVMWELELCVAQAVLAGDVSSADRAACDCTDQEAEYVKMTLADGMLSQTLRPHTLFRPSANAPASAMKLAHHVLRALHQRISEPDVYPGHYLGTIAALAASYGVSIDVMRDTVLLADQQKLIELRRGRHGGVYVSRTRQSEATMEVAQHLAALSADDELMALLTQLEEITPHEMAGHIALDILRQAIAERDAQPNLYH